MRRRRAEERFEEAARYRNRLQAVERLAERQAVERASIGTIDVIGVADGTNAPPCRCSRCAAADGRPLLVPPRERGRGGRRPRCSSSSASSTTASAPSIPPQILVPRGAGDPAALAELLWRAARLAGRGPGRPSAARSGVFSELAERERRARPFSSERRRTARARRLRRVEALEELRETLNLESLPIRIECFDISNGWARTIVGSMVVLRGRPTEEGALPQVRGAPAGRAGRLRRDGRGGLRGRFARLAAGATANEYDESFAATPNLVVIDGGKGQLSRGARGDAGFDLPRVAVIALAKREEEVFVPGRGGADRALAPAPRVSAPAASSGRSAPIRGRRFTVSGASARPRESMFDQLEGVGPARRRALLSTSGSVERVARRVGQEELEGVPGVPAKVARKVYAQLHKAGRG